MLRGGGTAFGHPKPRTYCLKLTKSMKRLAFQSALTDKGRNEAVRVIEDFELESPSTSSFAKVLSACGLAGQKVLFVTPDNAPVLVKSCRNIPGVQISTAGTVSTHHIVAADLLVLTVKAVEALSDQRLCQAE